MRLKEEPSWALYPKKCSLRPRSKLFSLGGEYNGDLESSLSASSLYEVVGHCRGLSQRVCGDAKGKGQGGSGRCTLPLGALSVRTNWQMAAAISLSAPCAASMTVLTRPSALTTGNCSTSSREISLVGGETRSTWYHESRARVALTVFSMADAHALSSRAHTDSPGALSAVPEGVGSASASNSLAVVSASLPDVPPTLTDAEEGDKGDGDEEFIPSGDEEGYCVRIHPMHCPRSRPSRRRFASVTFSPTLGLHPRPFKRSNLRIESIIKCALTRLP